ncbi:MAG: hypothetical protein GY847_15900 [Proteobacteria bacterium]|nr:hypothetical protein [Pseudomonadota bacterium]
MAKKKADKDYELIKKRSGRYAVKGKDGKYINGDAKVEILLKEKILKAPPKKRAAAKTEE